MEKVRKPCRIAMPENDGFEFYSCYQVREFEKLWKNRFKKANRGDNHRYNEYCEAIDSFLNQCKCLEK